MSNEPRGALAVLDEVNEHRPTYRIYTGGWQELGCTGCGIFKDQHLSYLSWEPHDKHREEVFKEALGAWLVNGVPTP